MPPRVLTSDRVTGGPSRLAVVLFSLALSGETLSASSWPFVRGASFDGHASSASLLDRWPESGPPVLWARTLGDGYSAFAGDERRVYTQYQTVTGQYLVCLDADTGLTVWEKRYAWPYELGGLYPGPRSTPTLHGDDVYYTSPHGVLACLSAETGRAKWRVDLIERFGAKAPDFGYAASPAVVDGMVIVPVGGPNASMVALDALDGTTLWQSGNDPISYTPAYPIEQAGRKLVVGYFQNSLNIFDRRTGEELVRLHLSTGYDEHSAWPIHREPYLWISAPFRGGSRLLELSLDPPALREVWKSGTMSNDVCSSVLVDGFVYGFDLRDVQSKVHRPTNGWFRCLDFETGDIRWTNGGDRRMLDDETTTDIGHASVIHADGKLLLLNDTGDLILLRATSSRCVELARTRVLGGRIGWTTPALIGSRVLLRSGSRVICLELGGADDGTDSLLRVGDLDDAAGRDWARLLLPYEPEYMMDAPTLPTLREWYVAQLVLGWVVAPLAALVVVGTLRLVLPVRLLPGRLVFRRMCWAFAFLAGAVGTSLLGHAWQAFVFTWPLSLAIAFETVVAGMPRRGDPVPERKSWWPVVAHRLPALVFVVICLAYYQLCRRLGLAFEWCFLMGFPTALPALWWSPRPSAERAKIRADGTAWLISALAFTTFYWTGAAVLEWKY